MLFNSLAFALFFVLTTVIYFWLSQRGRLWMLLIASCYFYMSFVPAYILILLLTILTDFWMGLKIEQAGNPRQRKIFLWISIVATVLILAVFKYANFLLENYNWLAQWLGWKARLLLDIVLPIGLSFHTFQSLSYVIEVYHGRQPAERDFLTYCVYVMYYPQLVAGPIERPQNILPQLHQCHAFDDQRVVSGMRLMLFGFFKKLVVADQLAPFADAVFDQPTSFSGMATLVGLVCFALQIYCDFSGYSDIAIGCSRVLGIELMVNFRRPYFACSIAEFWARWHISLSTWFRDYVYIPLGGNRTGSWRRAYNVGVVFLLSGFWHGARWTFVLWGALHFLYTFLEARLGWSRPVGRWNRLLGWFRTMPLVVLAWTFFRAESVRQAAVVLTQLLQPGPGNLRALIATNTQAFVQGGFFALVLLGLDAWHHDQQDIDSKWSRLPQPGRWFLYYALTGAMIFGVFKNQQFIYFQF